MKPRPFFRALSSALHRAGRPTAAAWILSFDVLTRCPSRDLRAILENLTTDEVSALSDAWQRGIATLIARGT